MPHSNWQSLIKRSAKLPHFLPPFLSFLPLLTCTCILTPDPDRLSTRRDVICGAFFSQQKDLLLLFTCGMGIPECKSCRVLTQYVACAVHYVFFAMFCSGMPDWVTG